MVEDGLRTAPADDLMDDLDLDAALGEAGLLAGRRGADDLERMLDAASDADESADGIRKFDFHRAHTISRPFEQNLRSVAENFAKIGSISFTNLLRTSVALEFRGVRLCSVGDYLEELPHPSCTATATLAPLKGHALIHLDLGVCFVILQRVMGGKTEPQERLREFTEIERGIFARFSARILERFQEACARLVTIEPRFVSLENNPSYITGVPAGETMAVLRFLLRLDTVEGPLEIGIPLPGFEPVRDIFDPEQGLEMRSPGEMRQDRSRILGLVQGTSSEVVVKLGQLELTLERLLDLKEGEVLDLPQSVNAPLVVEVEGRDMYLGEAGRVGQSRAVKLIERLPEE
ncbi:MAG: FliM/FliN family flagellar motor switch protein [Candidatus Krumholzibacteriia bacterium]